MRPGEDRRARLAQNSGSLKETREDRIRELVEQDPEKAAELIRKLFLNGKSNNK